MIRFTDSLVESFKLSDQWFACLVCTGEFVSSFDVSSTGARRNVKRFPVAAFDQVRGDFVSYCMKDYSMNQVPENHYAKAQRELAEEYEKQYHRFNPHPSKSGTDEPPITDAIDFVAVQQANTIREGFKNPNPVPCPRPPLEPIGEDEIETWLAERMLSTGPQYETELQSKGRLHREPPKDGLPLDVEDIQELDTKGTWPHSPSLNVFEKLWPNLRPESEWHEDDGTVLWYRVPIEEPPYVGSPLDHCWEDYYTHWQPLPPLGDIPHVIGMGECRNWRIGDCAVEGAGKLLDQLRAVMYSTENVRRRLAEHPQTRVLLAQFLGLLTADPHLREVLNTMAPERYPASHSAPSSLLSEASTDDERS